MTGSNEGFTTVFHQIQSLDISNNKLYSLEGMKDLAKHAPKLCVLKAANNEVRFSAIDVAAAALTQISAYIMHNLAVRNTMEAMRTAYAKSVTQWKGAFEMHHSTLFSFRWYSF